MSPKGKPTKHVTPKRQGVVALSGRYTPKADVSKKHSPKWLLYLLFSFLAVGVLLIVLNFLAILPGGESSWYLIGGILSLAVGFFVATRYH